MIALLESLSHLRELPFSNSSLSRDDPLDLPPAFPCSLTKLTCISTALRLFQTLTVNSFLTLQELCVTSDVLADADVQSVSPNLVALQKLYVILDSNDVEHSQSIASVISSLPELQHLTLIAVGVEVPHPHPLTTILLPRLPLSLHELDLTRIPTDPTDIAQLVLPRNITLRPKLNLIRLGPMVKEVLEGSDEREQCWWETAIECCTVAGIEVQIESC